MIKANRKLVLFIFLLMIMFGISNTLFIKYEERINYGNNFEQQLDIRVPKLMNKYNIPGVSIVLIENGDIVSNRNYGFADKNKKISVKEDTIFQVGSISKTITAWGIMKLVDEGKLEQT